MSSGPRALSGAELVAARREADFYQCLRLRELYPRITFKGKESIEGRETYVLEAPRAGNPKRWYFDAATGLLIKTQEKVAGSDELNEDVYQNYQTVDDVKVLITIRKSDLDDAVITLTEVKNNVPLDDARFEKPAAASKATLEPDTRTNTINDTLTIPFELSDNHIHLQTRINGSGPFSFVLDTGASVCVINEKRAAELGLKLRDLGELDIGVAEVSAQVALANGISFSLPGAEIPTKRAVVISFDYLESVYDHPIDGVLGLDVFKQFVVEIDYAARAIRLHDPKKYVYSGRGALVPFRLAGNVPVARSKIGLPGQPAIEGEFEIDTGMSESLLLRTPFVKKHNLSVSAQKKFPSISVGVGGEAKMVVGRVPVLQLGSVAIKAPVTLYSQAGKGELASNSNIGIIGGEILRRFTAIFDYSRKRMILEPNAALDEPCEHDMRS
ncbi:MAG: aspartyl protease family protein [Blastocatellia bacterium]